MTAFLHAALGIPCSSGFETVIFTVMEWKELDVNSGDLVLTLLYSGMWLWASFFASLGLSFSISKIKKAILNDLQEGGGLHFLSTCQVPRTPTLGLLGMDH